jgi:hypothetical protein
LKAIVDEDYVLNEAGDHLVISIEKLREEIVELAEEIRTKTENETAGTSRPKTTFTPTELNQAIGIFMGHGRVSRANLSGTTVKVAIAKIKKTDVLDEIKMCLGDVLNKSFCSVLQRNKYVTNADIDDKYTRALEGTYASGRSQLRQAVKDTIVADASWLKLYDPELDANNGEQLTDYWARQTNYNVRERIVEALKKFENKDLPARPIAPPAPPSGPEPKITDIVGTASPLTGVIPANTTLLTLNDPGNTPQFSVTEITPTPAIRGLTAAHFSIDATTRVLKCTQELNPGIYKVKIKLANASQKSAERDLDFKIEPEVPQDSDIEFTGNVAALEGIQASGTTLRTLKPSAPGKALIYSIASLKVNGIDKTNIGSFLRLEDNELKATRDLLLANYEVKFKATNSKGPPVEKLLPEIVIKVKKPEAVKFANGTGTEEIQARKVAAADSIVLFTLKPQPGVKFELISSIPDRIGIDAQGRVIIAAGSADLDLHAGDRVEIVVRGVTDTIPTVEGPPEILTIKVVAPAGTPQNAPGGGAHPDIKKLLTEIDELKKLIAAPKNAPLTENEKKEAIGLLTLKRRDYEAVLADPQLGTTDPDRKTIEEARDAVNRRIIDLTR